MGDPCLHFTEVTVRRLFGIQHDLEIRGLCDGINIIYGPNASGKTTLARAMRLLLWPQHAKQHRPMLQARFSFDGADWFAALEGAKQVYQRDGVPVARPHLPPAPHGERYHLYLHDLLAGEEGPDAFASAIMQEAAGGIDVASIAAGLDFDVTRRRTNSATRAVRKARSEWARVRERHAEIAREREKIRALEEEKAAARAAVREAEALEQALRCHEAREALRAAEEKVDAFPPSMEQIRGDEAERLVDLDRRLDEAREARTEAHTQHKAAAQRLTESPLSEDLPSGLLERLREEIEHFARLEEDVKRTGRLLEEACAEEEETWQQLALGEEKEELAALALPSLNELEHAAQRTAELQARLKAHEQLEAVLGNAQQEADTDALRRGLDALYGWLRAPQHGTDALGPSPLWPFAAGALLLVLAAALALVFTGGLSWILSGLVALMGGYVLWLGWSLHRMRDANRSEERTLRRRDFERTGLDAPRSWRPEEVQRRAGELRRALAAAELEDKKQEARERWARQRTTVAEVLEEQYAELSAKAARLGFNAGEIGSHSFYWLAHRLAVWQKAHGEATRARARQQRVQEEAENHGQMLSELLAPYGFEPVSSTAEARAARDRLQQLAHAYQKAASEKEAAEREIERRSTEVEALLEQRRGLFERLGLDEEDERQVETLCARFEAYQEARAAQHQCRAAFQAEKARLEDLPGYDPALLDLSERELEHRRQAAEEKARRGEELADQISRIEERIAQARAGHELEESRAAYERKRDALQLQRQRDYERAAGYVLAELIEEKTRDQDLPEVFGRARSLFAEITSGRYELALDREATVFRAIDTHTGKSHALDALSSGTKVQLMLAVRVAFVEMQERGCTLPLVLDETLANSDDGKATAIIEALCTIAKKDRQLIYLTAQQDEVGKWHEVLAGKGLPCEIVQLVDGAMREREHTNGTVVPQRPSAPRLEDPVDLSHEAYRTVAEVPPWSPRQPVGSLHLWYLIEDVSALHQTLTRGPYTWGMLQNMARSGSTAVTGLDEPTLRRAEALAEAARAWQDAWKIGRGQPVDRQALEATSAVTETFIDEVSALAEELEGDAEALLQQLRDGAVSGFLNRKKDELEEYLYREGYLDDAQPLSPEQMWQRVLARVSRPLQEDILDLEALERFFSRFDASTPHRPAEAPPGRSDEAPQEA